MEKGVILIETRDIDKQAIIDRHLKYLDGWKYEIISPPNLRSTRDYNHFLTSKEFWQGIKFEKVLIIQHDSGLLRKGIDDFMEWDYVGAPWAFQNHGGNGGLSLRSTNIMQEITETFIYDNVAKDGNEDVWFSNIMYNQKIGKLAPREVCGEFSVEAVYKLGTFGYHAIKNWHSPERCQKILTQYEKVPVHV